ncbi:DUF4359 domain-containing protein [Flavobacterium flavigenum]|uniref:DUF4359 domain-containing protein n=1 Tax=Flavobacterium flavigenum TaxID=3003258 RepID=UPI0022AC05E0|nr:DUF4359 domain-containing protein [Flavobacterium flavigenum]
MKKSNKIVIIFAIILLIAVFTNPSNEEHKQAVKSVINQVVQNSISENESDMERLGVLFGSSLAEKIIENSVMRDNYILFSITKITWKGESKSIGYGLFGNVFLSEKVKNAFNNNEINSYENTSEAIDTMAVSVDSTATE